MENNKILILYDNRGYVANSLLQGAKRTIDRSLLASEFTAKEYTVEEECLHDIVFPSKYKGWYVIYPSSEDAGGYYKEFIEDVLLRLKIDGAVLLPRFECFRAHHNKVFMELYRTTFHDDCLKTIKSIHFYSCNDVKRILEKQSIEYPVVLKTATGSGSAGVALAKDFRELTKKVRTMGRISFRNIHFTYYAQMKIYLAKLYRKFRGIDIVQKQPPREKMILQTFIPNLECDYKVLVFAEKYYILRRRVRNHDFRASGSGKLEFPSEMSEVEYQVLDLARKAYQELDTPLLSVDIAHDGKICHMIEFQCLNFGPYTLQFSECYYQKVDGSWKEIRQKSILEIEMAMAIDWYIKKHEGKVGNV